MREEPTAPKPPRQKRSTAYLWVFLITGVTTGVIVALLATAILWNRQQGHNPDPVAATQDPPANLPAPLDALEERFSWAIETKSNENAQDAIAFLEEHLQAFQKSTPELIERAKNSPAAGAALLLLDTYAICKAPEAPALLAGHLRSPIAKVRQEALFALASLDARAWPHLSVLLKSAQSGTVEDRRLAIWVLAHLITQSETISDADASQMSTVLAEAVEKDKDSEIRETALFALLVLGPREPAIIPNLVASLGREHRRRLSIGHHERASAEVDPEVSLRPILVRFGEQAWPALIAAIDTDNTNTRLTQGYSPNPKSQQVKEILTAQGKAPVPAIIAEIKRVHGEARWQSDQRELRRLKNLLYLLADFGLAASEAKSILEICAQDERLTKTTRDVLSRSGLAALAASNAARGKPAEEDTKPAPPPPQQVNRQEDVERLEYGRAALPMLEDSLQSEDLVVRYGALEAIAKIDPSSSALAAIRNTLNAQPRGKDVMERQRDPFREWFDSHTSPFPRALHFTYPRSAKRSSSRDALPREFTIDELKSTDIYQVEQTWDRLAARGELEDYLPEIIETLKRTDVNPHLSIGLLTVEAFCQLGPEARALIPALLVRLETNCYPKYLRVLLAIASDAPDYRTQLEDAFAKEKTRFASGDSHGPDLHMILAYLVWKNSKSPEALATLVSEMRLTTEKSRDLAMILVGEVGPEASSAVPELASSLQSKSPLTRELAIHALGKIGPAAKQAVPGLKSLLSDQKCRVEAAFALLSITPEDEAIISEIAEVVAQLEPNERQQLGHALARQEPPLAGARPLVLRLLSVDRRAANLHAAVALWKIEQTPQSRVALQREFKKSFAQAADTAASKNEDSFRRWSEDYATGAEKATSSPEDWLPIAVAAKARMAAIDLLPRVTGWDRGRIDESRWLYARTVAQLEVDPKITQEILQAGLHSSDYTIKTQAYEIAARIALKKTE